MSARLLQEDRAFRETADGKIASLTADESLRFFNTIALGTEDFEIVYVIVAPWKGRTVADALSFMLSSSRVQPLSSAQVKIRHLAHLPYVLLSWLRCRCCIRCKGGKTLSGRDADLALHRRLIRLAARHCRISRSCSRMHGAILLHRLDK